MFRSILVVFTISVLTVPTFASYCENKTLTCTLEKQTGEQWQLLSQSTAQFTMNPLHCMARLAIINPDETRRVYNAVASYDLNVVIFTTISGEVDYGLGAVIGFTTQNPLVMTYGEQRLSCKAN